MTDERKKMMNDAALERLLDAGRAEPDPAAADRVMARLDVLPMQRRRLPLGAVLAEWFGVGAGGHLWPRLATLATASILGVFIGLSDLTLGPTDPVSMVEQDLVSVVLDGVDVAGLEMEE